MGVSVEAASRGREPPVVAEQGAHAPCSPLLGHHLQYALIRITPPRGIAMRKSVALITGASGEIGHGLITRMSANGSQPIITLDLNPLPPELAPLVRQHINGSILDNQMLDRILAEYEVDLVFHLAALLSTRCEIVPASAHRVNVEGTMNLLEFAQRQG